MWNTSERRSRRTGQRVISFDASASKRHFVLRTRHRGVFRILFSDVTICLVQNLLGVKFRSMYNGLKTTQGPKPTYNQRTNLSFVKNCKSDFFK